MWIFRYLPRAFKSFVFSMERENFNYITDFYGAPMRKTHKRGEANDFVDFNSQISGRTR